jgi:hypothetical protein
MFPYGYVPRGATPSEPKVHVTAETPREAMVVDAAKKHHWSGNQAGTTDWLFQKDGATPVRVTRDALARLPILAETIVRQLERS